MKKKLFRILLLFLPLTVLAAENNNAFPLISRLDVRDLAYRQYQANVEAAYRRIGELEHRGMSKLALLDELTVFLYQVRENEDIFSLAARCNVPYSAIASLNRLNHPSSLSPGAMLLLPSIPGIFMPGEPASDLEYVMAATQKNEAGFPLNISRDDKKEVFYFFPGVDFSSTERAFFLNTSFRFPMRNFRLTSIFGPRISPITGNAHFHGGFDLAAPEGTEIFAARDGVVTEVGENRVLGKYIIIKHGETWESVYGHLSLVVAESRSSVQSGVLIGRVGSTGLSTGPHLHFELRQNGKAQDPGKYLFRKGQRP